MATALPEARVSGFIGVPVADSDDTDDAPEIAPCTSGFIDFIPLVDEMQYLPGSPNNPFLLGKGKFTAEVDAQGRLSYRGQPYIKLLDLGSEVFNPRIPAPYATYRVEFRSLRLSDGTTITLKPRNIRPVPGVNNDLTLLSPIDGVASPVPMTRGEAGPAGIVWRGNWNATTEYAVNDGVYRPAGSFRCLVAGVSSTAPENDITNWFPIALKGVDGSGGAGTITPDTIVGLAEYIRDTIGATLQQGSNVTVAVDDPGDKITISASGGGSSTVTPDTITGLQEYIRDTMGTALKPGGGIAVVVDDSADSITLSLADLTVNWGEILDRPTAFPPSPHTHGAEDLDETVTPAAIGAATETQGAKADSAIQLAELNDALALKADKPVTGKTMIGFESTSINDPRPGGTNATIEVWWRTTYDGFPANALASDVVYKKTGTVI